MSRIGKKPVTVPPGVEVKISSGKVTVKGAKGELSQVIVGEIGVALSEDGKEVIVSRTVDDKRNRAFQGLMRSLIQNMVIGVSQGFTKQLEIVGVGYRGALEGEKLVLNLGYADPVEMAIPAGIEIVVHTATRLDVLGIDKQAVGQMAAVIRKQRPPEPYKGKGIRYLGEQVRRLAGKSFAAVE